MRYVRGAALLAALAFAFGACSARPAVRARATVGSKAPEIALVGNGGVPFSLDAERGHPAIVFFGYTHCEDVCPLTLARIHSGLAKLAPDDRKRFVVAFVTVDPRRDDARTLTGYVTRFDPSFLGLTGETPALHAAYSAYGVFRQRIPRNLGKPYLVAHEGALFFIDAGGTLRTIGDWRDAPEKLRNDLNQIARS